MDKEESGSAERKGEEKMKAETERMAVIVYTAKHRIEGAVHVQPGTRFSDFFSSDARKFLSVTAAKIFDIETGDLLYEAKFLQLNRENVIMAIPADQIVTEGKKDKE